ncbi:MAG: hypothetical protein AAF587_43375 [Bacteroidota bacterium]
MDVLQHILTMINSAAPESLALSLGDCHVRGLFSLVIRGQEFGHLTRIFVAQSEIKPFDVQLHTHRYSIRLTTISGQIRHHRAFRHEAGELKLSEYSYSSGITAQSTLTYLGETRINCQDYYLPPGTSIELSNTDIHSISCSQGSIWMVEELGYRTAYSRVLGIPFEVDGMYANCSESQIAAIRTLVIQHLNTILSNTLTSDPEYEKDN